MKLYSFFRSSASFRMRIALNLKGLDYDYVSVNLPGMEHHAAEFRKLNPQGFVPTLVDGERALIQSMAIIEWLDEIHPEPPFLPADADARQHVRALAHVIGCDMHPLNNVRVLKYLRDPLGHGEDVVQSWYEHWIAEGFIGLEALLAESARTGNFCHGDVVTMADILLVPQVFNAQRFNCPTGDYPVLMGIFDNCMELDSFQKAEPMNQPDAA